MSLTEFLDIFSKVSEKPHKFLSIQEDVADNAKNLVKSVYDYVKDNEEESNRRTLPKLIIDNFDDEQIWQELELQNESCSNDLIQVLPVLSAKSETLKFPLVLKCLKVEEESTPHLEATSNDKSIKDTDSIEYEPIDEDENSEDDKDNSTGFNVEQPSKKVPKKGNLKPSIVDDKFFKLSELELFLKNEDRNYDKPRKDADAIDFFENTDDTTPDYKYSDFFENPEGGDGFNKKRDYESDKEEEENEYEDDDEEEDDEYKDLKKGETDEVDSDEGEDDLDEQDENDSDLDLNIDEDDDEINTNNKSTKRKLNEGEGGDSSDEDKSEKTSKDKKSKKVRFSLMESEEEESDEETNDLFGSKMNKKTSDGLKSSLEQRQERLGHVIEKLEEEAISDKPWQLKGEVTASSRPENSLLEEIVDFDLSVRPAPLITGEVTVRLEDIIKQRVKDKAWDDVERKVKPIETPSEFKKKLALDQEKSKLSLAEVYEQEFIRQREAATGTDDAERQEVEPPLHAEVRSLMGALFNKLDALSNYHYTPRPVAPELRVVSNVKAVAMEEVAPVSVADSALLAPQEITGKKRHTDLLGKEERTKTDKKRERRLKKARQRQRQRDKEKMAKDVAKINPGMGNKYSKLKAVKQLSGLSNVTKMDETKEKTVRSSTAFFNKLQDEVKNQIKSKTSTSSKKKDKMSISAKRLKL